MRFTRVKLENWKNFAAIDVPLRRRAFIVGPNASGKSNLLDAFRFLRDVADPEGGLQRAISRRGGIGAIRSLFARTNPAVMIEVDVGADDDPTAWKYRLALESDKHGNGIIKEEKVQAGGKVLLHRPDKFDHADPSRLTQTALEQVVANQKFRDLQEFFSQVDYLHLVPQLVREPDRSVGRHRDPYGGDFLEQVAASSKRQLESRLKRINDALRAAVPQLEGIELQRDKRGVPHLRGRYAHWRPNAGWQSEDQFSDGTLRLLGLLWALQDGKQTLLLEEPELSLHLALVRLLPGMMARATRVSKRQLLVSTHSADLLNDEGIDGNEVLLLQPGKEATTCVVAASHSDIRRLLSAGLTVAEAVLPQTTPPNAQQLLLFGSE